MNQQEKRTMGQVLWKEHEIVLEGSPPYQLPDILDEEFVLALLSQHPGDEYFIGELATHFTSADKRKLYNTCKKTLSRATWLLYCKHAKTWAAVINETNKWNLDDFKFVYRAHLGSWWAQEVLITAVNNRFVTTARGTFTFPEFELHYGKDIVKHISEYKVVRSDELDDIVQCITADLITQKLTVVDPDGKVLTQEFAGMESQDPSKWLLPEGYVFLSA